MSRPTRQGQAGTYQSDQAPFKNDGIPNATTCYHGLVLQAMQKKPHLLYLASLQPLTLMVTTQRNSPTCVSPPGQRRCQHPARQKCLGSHIPTSADICSMHIWLQLPLVLIWLSAPLKQVASATCLAKLRLPLGKLKGVQKEKDKAIEFLHALALRHLPLKPIAALTFQPL